MSSDDSSSEKSENTNTYANTYTETGNYVYIDRCGTLHVRRRCHKMFDGKSGVRFVKTEDLDSADAVYMCSYCVTDSQAAKLKIIAEMQKYKAKK